MMELYAAAAPNGRRALFVIEELELPYRLHLLDFAQREQDRPEFRQINPLGHVPVLVDPEGPGGAPITIAQSGAVVFYLARKAGRLLPQDEAARIRVEQFVWMTLSDIAAASTTIFLGSKFEASPGRGVVELFRDRLKAFLRFVDDGLASHEYVCGEISIADFALLPLILLPHVARAVDEIGASQIDRWGAAMAARPSVERALAKAVHH